MRDAQEYIAEYFKAKYAGASPAVTVYWPAIAPQAAFPYAQVRRDYTTTAHPRIAAAKMGTLYLVLASRGFSSSQHEAFLEHARSLESLKLYDLGAIEYARIGSLSESTDPDPNIEGVIRTTFTALVEPLVYKSALVLDQT